MSRRSQEAQHLEVGRQVVVREQERIDDCVIVSKFHRELGCDRLCDVLTVCPELKGRVLRRHLHEPARFVTEQ